MSRLLLNICLIVAGIACRVVAVNGQTYTGRVQFKSFEAGISTKNTVQLKWELTEEVPAGVRFLIERSRDSAIFQPLQGLVIEPEFDARVYRYTDHLTLADSAYYRVVLLNDTVQSAVSNIRKVLLPVKSRAEITIMPNPVFNNAALIINDESTGDISCILYDMTGKKIRTYQIRKTTIYLQQILDMYSVPKGEYVLSIQSASWQESKRILKQ